MKGNEELGEKRKREITPEKIKAMTEFAQNAKKEYNVLKKVESRMVEELKNFKSIIKEILNAKKETKSAIQKLYGYVNRIHQSIGVMENILEELKTKRNQINIKNLKGDHRTRLQHKFLN